MGFGSGSGDDPWNDEEPEEATTEEPEEQAATMDAGSPQVSGDSRHEQPEPNGRSPNAAETSSTNSQTVTDSSPRSGAASKKFSDIDVTDHYSTTELARMLIAEEFHEENPRVPYATWRTGTATGRSRTTIELNPEVDELVKTAMREFEDRYDAEINKADLREFALVYGLMHPDEVFEMAEEWGLQYNG